MRKFIFNRLMPLTRFAKAEKYFRRVTKLNKDLQMQELQTFAIDLLVNVQVSTFQGKD